MSHFKVLFNGIDVAPIVQSVTLEHPELWNQHSMRTTFNHGKPFGDCSDIILRYNDPALLPAEVLEAVNYPAMFLLPAAQALVHTLMYKLRADRLGRVMITKLPAGGHITAHADAQELTSYYDRYHICLQDNPDTFFICGGETFRPNVGDIFWFNNALTHEVVNLGSTDRLTLICDLKKPVLRAFYGSEESAQAPVAAKPAKPPRAPGIAFYVEKFADIQDEMRQLSVPHYKELAMNQRSIPLAVDWENYCLTEERGILHTYTARDGDKLIGYIVSFVGAHLHYKTTIHCVVDVYFLLEKYRKNGLGTKWFKAWEKELKDNQDVRKIITGTKLKRNHSKLLHMLGYKHTDQVFTKLI